MIGRLKGAVDEIYSEHIILDVSGVGYKVFLTGRTLATLQLGSQIALNIEMHVREDQMLLYGFTTAEEQKWFILLQTVQGVGGRMALAILSAMPPQKIWEVILAEDQRAIKSISGIGPKLAARIINELKNHSSLASNTFATIMRAPQQSSAANDALEALTTLGFARVDSLKVINDVSVANQDMSTEQIIKLALAKIGANH